MTINMKIAFWCYFLVGVLTAGFGFTCILKSSFMPYHSIAVGMPWVAVPPNFQVLIIALMRAIGGACIALTVGFYIILLIPFRRNAYWSWWTLPILGMISSAGGLYAMSHVAFNTPASPPWIILVIGIILSLLGFLFTFVEYKSLVRTA